MSAMLVVGGSNMDIAGHSTRRLALGDSNPGSIRYAPGGVARNVAENLARLGHRTRLLSAVGDDAAGHSLLQATAAAGVDVGGCAVLAGQATSSYLSVHDADGDMCVAVNDMRIADSITPGLLAPYAEDLAAASALLFDCNVSEATLGWLCAHSGTAPVFVDTVSGHKCLRIAPYLHGVHLLKPNRLEAQALSGLPLQSPADAPAAAQWLHARGVRQVVLSWGEQGVFWSQQHGAQGWQAAPDVAVENATGAGDALMAGLMHMADRPLAEAVRFACACAALTLGVPGSNDPLLSVQRVQQYLAIHS